MQAANDFRTGNSTQLRNRTVVLRRVAHTAPLTIQDRLRDLERLLDALIDRVPQRVKSFAHGVAQPRVALPMVVLVSVFAIATLYYYNKLASEIDVRLQGSSLDNSVAIFTGPFTVSVGDRLPIAELLEYLQAAGYHQK